MKTPIEHLIVLSQCVHAAMALDGVDGDACRQLSQRITEGNFNLVVAGEFKRGKSSVINALLGAEVLPVAVVPLTSVVTLICHGDDPRATVRFRSGDACEIALSAIMDYVTEKGNPGNAKGVENVTVAYPSEWLRDGIRLVDTPGIGSVHQHNTDVTYRYLPQADAVLFVASVDQPVGSAELDFLVDIRRHAGKLICLLNKADYLSADELRESVAFTAQAVREALDAPVPVMPFSARQALRGKLQGNVELVRQSGLPPLDHLLQRLVGEERSAIWVDSLSRNLRRILARARLALELEQKALCAPLEQIETSLALFARRKQEALQSISDYDILLIAETRKLQKERIEPELESFKTDLKRTLAAGIERRFEASKHLSSKALQTALDAYMVGAIKSAYDDWRASADDRVALDFKSLVERFWSGIQQITDELLRDSAQLFALRYDATNSDFDWRPSASFRYKFWNEPANLSMLGASLVLALPKCIGTRLIRDRAKRQATDLIETQAGRVRHDFEERLKLSAGDFRRELLTAMEAIIAGIETAIGSGMALRRCGAPVAATRREQLIRATAEIDALEMRLKEIAQ